MFYLLFNEVSLFQIASLKARIAGLECQCGGKVSLFFPLFHFWIELSFLFFDSCLWKELLYVDFLDSEV